MSGETKPTLQSETPFDPSLVEHAVRCWDAERENANRLSARGTLVLSALAALFGLGLFKIEWFRGVNDADRIRWVWAVWTIKAFLALALVIFGAAFWKIIGPGKGRKGQGEHASSNLELPATVLEEVPKADAARRLIFIRVYRAYEDLRERNADKKKRQDSGQQLFILGLCFVLLAVLLYLLASEPPRI